MCRSRENLSLFGTSGAIQLGKIMKEGKERRYHMLQLQWGTCEETCEWWLCRFAVPLAMLTMIIIIMTPTILISMYISIIIIITIITHRLSIPSWHMCQGTIYPQRPQRHRKHIPRLHVVASTWMLPQVRLPECYELLTEDLNFYSPSGVTGGFGWFVGHDFSVASKEWRVNFLSKRYWKDEIGFQMWLDVGWIVIPSIQFGSFTYSYRPWTVA